MIIRKITSIHMEDGSEQKKNDAHALPHTIIVGIACLKCIVIDDMKRFNFQMTCV